MSDMTKEGIKRNAIIYKQHISTKLNAVDEDLREYTSNICEEAWAEGAAWMQKQMIANVCHALDKVLSQQMLAELVKVMEGE